MQDLRLTHPDLDFWFDVRVSPFASEQWIARAHLAEMARFGLFVASRCRVRPLR